MPLDGITAQRRLVDIAGGRSADGVRPFPHVHFFAIGLGRGDDRIELPARPALSSSVLDNRRRAMKRILVAGLALFAVTLSGRLSHAYVNYPWCITGDSRGLDCYFSTQGQCMQDGRNRGFGSQCVRNPNYNRRQGAVVESAAARKD